MLSLIKFQKKNMKEYSYILFKLYIKETYEI